MTEYELLRKVSAVPARVDGPDMADHQAVIAQCEADGLITVNRLPGHEKMEPLPTLAKITPAGRDRFKALGG